ncbi:MAG: DUF3877 family protein [Velocimicrobium sp.]
MNVARLRSTLYEMIKEQQIKLGFAEETVRLYFPKDSFDKLLGLSREASKEERREAIALFKEMVKAELGNIKVTYKDERFCIGVSAKGSCYIHEHVLEPPFLVDLIHLFQQHDITIGDVKQVFDQTERSYICEKQVDGEFDYLIHFEDSKEDPYYYCIKFDEGHASYHRFHQFDVASILE